MNQGLAEARQQLSALLQQGGLDDGAKQALARVLEGVEQGIQSDQQQQKQLYEAQLDVKAASNAKADFLSRVSHELKTPISAIRGMAHIALNTNDQAKGRECLEVIDSQSQHLLSIVQDVLDMSGIESNAIVLTNERFSFESMLMKLVGEYAQKTEAKRQKLYCHIDVNMPTQFEGDEERLSQVIGNLLSNAIKFTPEGGAVSVMAKQREREGDLSTIELAVSDDGIGISKQDQKQLFQVFQQADGSATRQFGGTGLGLALSRQLVQMMGGQISVDSDSGRGSTFRFTAKLVALDDGSANKAQSKPGVHGMNVMIVDPDEDAQKYFAQVMDSFKVHAVSANNIEEAMHLVERGRKTSEPISILYIDWSLAEKDGVNMAQALKRQYSVSTVAMLPVTQMGESLITAHEDTAMRYIAKPLFPSALLRSIYEISGSPIRQDEPSAAQRYSFVGYHVLLAEDVEINRRIFDQIMQGTQVTISHAENGAIAVELFQKNPDLYDMILMDIHMPVMDGYEATRYIRSTPGERSGTIPIVAVTANAFQQDIELSQQAGMNGHLTKPIDVEKMFELMTELLKPGENPRHKQTPEELRLEAERMQQALDRLRANPWIDYEDALSRVRGSARVLKILLTSFGGNSQWSQLKTEVADADYEAAARTASAIKGACANLSLGPLREKIEELEMQLQSHFHVEESIAEVEQTFNQTQTGIADALDQMRALAKE